MRRYPLTPITRGLPCRRPWSASGSVPGTIRKESSQTRYTGLAITVGTAKDMGYAFLAPSGEAAAVVSATARKQEYQDSTDRLEVEWAFSLSKRCYGMGLIVVKLEETQLTTIALSVFVTNLFKLQRRIHSALLWICQFIDMKYSILSFYMA